jgi:hypothetical protein
MEPQVLIILLREKLFKLWFKKIKAIQPGPFKGIISRELEVCFLCHSIDLKFNLVQAMDLAFLCIICMLTLIGWKFPDKKSCILALPNEPDLTKNFCIFMDFDWDPNPGYQLSTFSIAAWRVAHCNQLTSQLIDGGEIGQQLIAGRTANQLIEGAVLLPIGLYRVHKIRCLTRLKIISLVCECTFVVSMHGCTYLP